MVTIFPNPLSAATCVKFGVDRLPSSSLRALQLAFDHGDVKKHRQDGIETKQDERRINWELQHSGSRPHKRLSA